MKYQGFDIIHKFPIPETICGSRFERIEEIEWLPDFRQWCFENLQEGYKIANLFGDRWVVNVIDEIDYDLLVLRWGK